MSLFNVSAVCLFLVLNIQGSVAGADSVKPSAEQVQQWLKEAEKGEAKAQCELGACYLWGKGVGQSFPDSEKWFRKSAEQGNDDAQFYVGFFCSLNLDAGQRLSESVEWFRKASEQGNPKAQNCLGVAYAKGEGVKCPLGLL